MPPTDWRTRAACIGSDPELWFPADNAARARSDHAKTICGGCPVRDACLTDAQTGDARYGIWGGYDEDERDTMRRRGRDGVSEHGTVSGHRAHRARNEAPCDPCREAKNAQSRHDYARRPRRDRSVA